MTRTKIHHNMSSGTIHQSCNQQKQHYAYKKPNFPTFNTIFVTLVPHNTNISFPNSTFLLASFKSSFIFSTLSCNSLMSANWAATKAFNSSFYSTSSTNSHQEKKQQYLVCPSYLLQLTNFLLGFCVFHEVWIRQGAPQRHKMSLIFINTVTLLDCEDEEFSIFQMTGKQSLKKGFRSDYTKSHMYSYMFHTYKLNNLQQRQHYTITLTTTCNITPQQHTKSTIALHSKRHHVSFISVMGLDPHHFFHY